MKPATQGHYADVNGIHMYYEEHGKGPALLLLHGGAGSGAQFEHQIDAFSKLHHLIVPDACGQGRTNDRPGLLTYHTMAEDVVDLMDRLEVVRADIVGWSDGGVIGLDIALHHPDRVNHLVTFGANFQPDGLNPQDVAWNDTATVESFGPEMRKFYESVAPDPSHYEEAMSKIISLWRTQPNFSERELGRIRAKVLVVAGEHDVVRPDHTKALAKAIPNSELWIVPGATHSVMQEQPDIVNPRVLEFLSR